VAGDAALDAEGRDHARASGHAAGVHPPVVLVYYTFIALCLVSFGVITIAFADSLAAGGMLARAHWLAF
jgi:hypothetical protein